MIKKGLVLASALALAGLGGCEKRAAEPPAVAAKARADDAVETAKKRQDIAENKLSATAAKESKVAGGPDKGWAHDWATFALASDRTTDKGDYTIERENDASIVAWRKTQPVAGSADEEVKDATLSAAVTSRLGQDSDDSLHAIQVSAKDHVVDLHGAVKDPDAAGNAVRIALGTPGTEKVVSHLAWASK